MDINAAYVLCQTIFNKSQNGNITPSQFNNAAPICQMSVLNELLGNEQEYSPTRPIPRYGFRLNQKIDENVRPLIVTPVTIAVSSGVAVYPAAALYLDTITETSSGKIVCPKEYDESLILNQSVVKPPIVGRAIYYVLGDSIFILPTSITSINATYVKEPTPPFWNFTIVNQAPVYNSSGSQDFQLGKLVHLRIVAKILQFFGLNLSLQQVTAYAQALEAQGA